MSDKKFFPNGDRYLVKQEAVVDKVGGLFIPETSAEAPAEGVIQVVGNFVTPADKAITAMYAPYDKVAFGRYAGVEIKLGGDKYLILKQDEILGKIVED